MRVLLRNNRIWIVLLLAALLLTGCGQERPSPAPTAAPTATPEPTPEPPPRPTADPASGTDVVVTPPASGTDVNVPVTPEPTPEPTSEPTPPPAPTRVDDSFFGDAAFFGNSLMEGLHLFGGLKSGDFYSGTSASVVSVSTVKDFKDSAGAPSTMLHALLEKQYGKIFVLFGINELGFHIDGFTAIYSELLAELAAGEPEARIYIFSLTPITEKRSLESDLFTKERIQEFNTAVAAMAEKNGYTYVDLFTALADENGWLPEEDASDGIHFTLEKYAEWAEFLRTYPYESGDRIE